MWYKNTRFGRFSMASVYDFEGCCFDNEKMIIFAENLNYYARD